MFWILIQFDSHCYTYSPAVDKSSDFVNTKAGSDEVSRRLPTVQWPRAGGTSDANGIIFIIICCRHWRSWPSNRLCRQLSRRADCWEIDFCVMKSFRLTVYSVRCLPLLLVPQIFPLIRSVYLPRNCSCPFLMILNRDLLYPAISITSCQSMIFSIFF